MPLADVVAVLRSLRDDHGFDLLMDLTAIDWAEGASPRFTMVYHLFSTSRREYLRIAAACAGDEEPSAPTITGLWPAANWHERECYDMFGIRFEGHPDLRRILMWDGYPDFPLAEGVSAGRRGNAAARCGGVGGNQGAGDSPRR